MTGDPRSIQLLPILLPKGVRLYFESQCRLFVKNLVGPLVIMSLTNEDVYIEITDADCAPATLDLLITLHAITRHLYSP